MKDFHKQPNFYFIVIPAIAAIWAITAAGLSMPTASDKFDRRSDDWTKSLPLIKDILDMDPGRLNLDAQKRGSLNFDYAETIADFTEEHRIPETGYSLRASKTVVKKDKKTKSADMSITSVSIVQFTKFISGLLYKWPELQMDTLKLTKLKEGPDAWKVDLKLTYTF